MEEKGWLAHKAEDGRQQLLREHLENTARLAGRFAAPFGGEAQAELAGLGHDLGKYSREFQRRLEGSPEKPDHSTAGAFVCARQGQVPAAFAVAGHHGGLPDGGGRGDSAEAGTLMGRLRRAGEGRLPDFSAWQEEIRLPEPAIPEFAKEPAAGMFYTRMLYSCLVDADYQDTENFMDPSAPARGGSEGMAELEARLERYIKAWYPPRGELNRRRCAALEACRQAGRTQPPGLFTLTLPTGGGKTVTSLAFALAQARAFGLNRVIYVIPYTSVIEQTARVFREILGPAAVLEHHSGMLYDLEGQADPESIRLARATENWDSPVVVTTAVQFFESLYSNRPSQCRKLHNIAGSVVIFDEAQTLPLPSLRPCVWAISQLAAHYRVSAVLCTATQPALGPLFEEFLPGKPIRELCPEGLFRAEEFRRVRFCREGVLAPEEMAGRLARLPQVLCVVNSRRAARQLYETLCRAVPGREGLFHLSTLMYPAHRQVCLARIRERLRQGKPCRVISTSLIEAGVNLDFPAVFREEAGLDSILQAAGRCNREGRRPPEESLVTLFRRQEAPPPLLAIPLAAGQWVMERYEDFSTPQAVRAYFRELLGLKGQDAQDQEQILPRMDREFFPFAETARRFRIIDSAARTVYIPREEGVELAGRLRAGERSRELFRRLGRYGVSVYEGDFIALEKAGQLELLEDGSALLRDAGLYSDETGLDAKAGLGQALIL